MKKLRRINRWLTQKAHLPNDVIYDYPRLTLIGHVHLYIENHKGLKQFQDHQIIVEQNGGQIMIEGKSLVIKSLMKNEIVIEGTILSVTQEAT
ncbi:sporulation protein YqfC [Allobacillus sp. GCM10007491]|uniref:Sporulation protein YqfC n=1 Tax=Allobacillus saliphilus TaxID=2912308 RepID=A0A941CX76_9BACI|nr:sporulation protein YqfC [Allobacillus saliphilus]MBR7554326.1 sporulation protein YqfC [Allobacillus saliphilus]